MAWYHVMVVQIVVGSFATLWYRRTSVIYKNKFFLISLVVYATVALAGIVLSLVANGGAIARPSNISELLYVLAVGVTIPISWLAQYKLISHIGAANIAIAQAVNFLTVALFGYVLLGDSIGRYTLYGAIILIGALFIAFSIDNKASARDKLPLQKKIIFVTISSLALAIGLSCEKLAIDSMGVWSYVLYGWTLQFIGAAILFIIFGRVELKKVQRGFWPAALLAGVLTSLTGALFIIALSKGMLSEVILSSIAKVVLTTVLAVIVLKERNKIGRRFAALTLAIVGLIMLFAS
jgi:drug/metabolite transporter (DMT)-like permease